METEMKNACECVPDPFMDERIAASQRRMARKALRREQRALWRRRGHRRRMQAASTLLLVGTLGITYLIMHLSAIFGAQAHLARYVGEWAAGGIFALLGLGLSILLLYPLWLGLLSYAASLWQGVEHAEGRLFSYYSERRLRFYAIRQGLFRTGRFLFWSAGLVLCVRLGTLAAEASMGEGYPVRSALILLFVLLAMVAIPVVLFVQGTDYALAHYLYCSYPKYGVFRARRLSTAVMRHRRGAYFRILLRLIPWVLLSLCTLGIGMAIWVLPKYVLSAAGFACRPTS